MSCGRRLASLVNSAPWQPHSSFWDHVSTQAAARGGWQKSDRCRPTHAGPGWLLVREMCVRPFCPDLGLVDPRPFSGILDGPGSGDAYSIFRQYLMHTRYSIVQNPHIFPTPFMFQAHSMHMSHVFHACSKHAQALKCCKIRCRAQVL